MANIVGKCPKCNKNIIESSRGYSCEDKETCGFHLNYHNLAGLGVPFVKKSVIKALLRNPDSVVELKAKESGKSYKKKAWLYKGAEYTAWTIVVSDDFYNENVGFCPKCKNIVIEYSNIYKCMNENCDFIIPGKWKNHTIDVNEAKKLLSNETIEINCFSRYDKKKKWIEYIWIEKNVLYSETKD